MSDSPFKKPVIQRQHANQPAEKTDPMVDYSTALITAPELSAMDVPKRPPLLGKWMHEADLGFVFAARGVGKT